VFEIYLVIVALFLFFLCPPVRKYLYEKWHETKYFQFIVDRYEGHLHALVVLRLILLSLAPIMVSLVTFRLHTTINQLFTLVLMGVSIAAFWVVELPLLTKANIDVTFATALSNDANFNDQIFRWRPRWLSEATFMPEKEHFLVVRVYNLGFHTYENASVTVYPPKEFEIIPNDKKYANIDFFKPFKVQKSYNGVRFTPTDDNFQSIPPQESLLFPILLKLPERASNQNVNAKIVTEFSSDNSWGITKISKPCKIVADLANELNNQNH